MPKNSVTWKAVHLKKKNVQKFGRCGDSNYINILMQN